MNDNNNINEQNDEEKKEENYDDNPFKNILLIINKFVQKY